MDRLHEHAPAQSCFGGSLWLGGRMDDDGLHVVEFDLEEKVMDHPLRQRAPLGRAIRGTNAIRGRRGEPRMAWLPDPCFGF